MTAHLEGYCDHCEEQKTLLYVRRLVTDEEIEKRPFLEAYADRHVLVCKACKGVLILGSSQLEEILSHQPPKPHHEGDAQSPTSS